MTRTASAALLAGALLVGLAGCGSGTGSEERTLEVLAAASLSGTFTELATRFEEEHPGVSVRLVLDSSATLAEQVNQGAPADVLATADQRTLQVVVDAGHGRRHHPAVEGLPCTRSESRSAGETWTPTGT